MGCSPRPTSSAAGRDASEANGTFDSRLARQAESTPASLAMGYTLRLHPRTLAEIEDARDGYALVEQGDSFVTEVETVLEAIQAMPLRFPIVYGLIHRALLRRCPFAAFFRVRPSTAHVVLLAVLPQLADPSTWPNQLRVRTRQGVSVRGCAEQTLGKSCALTT